MSEEQPAGQVVEPEPTLEDIEKLFADLLEQMSTASKKMSLLGKRIREATALEPVPDLAALEQTYLTLPVPRPSWFEFVAEQSEIIIEQSKKFAPTQAPAPTNTQHGHT